MQDQVQLFGIRFDRLRMADAVERIVTWCRAPYEGRCRFVVTPNVDHAVMYQEQVPLQAAYADAALVLVDGTPIVWASRWLRRRLPERVAGSDLVPALFQHVASEENSRNASDVAAPLRVFLLGAAPGVAERAARTIHATWPAVSVVGVYSPPIGFEDDEDENGRILEHIAQSAPDLLLVGLGAPKQELWVHRHRGQIRAKVALCVGATIDFLAGAKSRSPRWMRRVGLEWLHRMLTEPRRLARRYARDAWIFPQLIWRQWRGAV